MIAEQFTHEPKTKEVTSLLERQNRLPKAILSDHGPQFKENWMVQTARHRTTLRASILPPRQRQNRTMHTKPEKRVRQPPQKIPRIAQKQTTRIQRMAQPLTLPQRNKHVPSTATPSVTLET